MSATEVSPGSETGPAPLSTEDGASRAAVVLKPMHDPTTATGRLGLAFKRAMVAVRRLRGRESQRLGQISYAQYSLLFGLAETCETSARELAGHADLSPATVAQMLENLEANGLVQRTRSAQDRRVVLSTLTEHGAAIVADRYAQMEGRWRAALSGFNEEELDAASRVLERLGDYFDGLFDGDADNPPPSPDPVS